MLHHVRELERLMRDTFPDGAWMKGFQFSFAGDELHQGSVWASAISPDYTLLHMRPGIFEGFREQHGSAAKMGDGT
ncbi:hypothetical protein D1823_19710 (plasmid) [Ruegeria sp. AD91A]|uniref:hypothetical protein n=1 Tax=Ruegeria sp. AD91A TaxID=2293862 RepID=UPI000E4AA738|nr:hypothetical protein [Ruegeria sp. AD91A]AXT28941.1 hypothetical protein D1823_19710 [Ruegeria sp. AD91A]